MNIVRYSKFRNISGKPFMKNSFYENLRVNTNLPNTLVKVNPQFFAVPWQGPGGRLAIWPVSKIGKLPTEVNWLEHGNELAEFECHPFNDHIFITGGEGIYMYYFHSYTQMLVSRFGQCLMVV